MAGLVCGQDSLRRLRIWGQGASSLEKTIWLHSIGESWEQCYLKSSECSLWDVGPFILLQPTIKAK